MTQHVDMSRILLYELDPEADVVIVLKEPNSQKYEVDIESVHQYLEQVSDQRFFILPTLKGQRTLVPSHSFYEPSPIAYTLAVTDGGIDQIRIRASSNHLRLASSTFEAALKWAKRSPVKELELQEKGWDVEAFLIILRIIHGNQDLGAIDLEKLTKIAVIVDYYDCYTAVSLSAKVWIETLTRRQRIPTCYGRDSILWWTIAWVFRDKDILAKMTELAGNQCRGPILHMNLPLPEHILGRF